MKSISLAGKAITFVDDEDYEFLVGNFCWWHHKDKSHPLGYAQGTRRGSRELAKQHVYMHRIIAIRADMDLSGGLLVDHKSLDTLDNRRGNLRPATYSQSQHNKGIQSNNKSGYKGVSWNKHLRKWCVQLNKNRRQIARCYFTSLLDAAQASMLLRFLAHGEFAKLK